MRRTALVLVLRALSCVAIAVDLAHLWLASRLQVARRWVVRRLCGR